MASRLTCLGLGQHFSYCRYGSGIGVKCTFPKLGDLPARSFERRARFSITGLISGELGKPIFRPRCGKGRAPAPEVLVPEAAVHEEREVESREDQVGGSGKIAPMQTKAIAQGVGGTADAKLGLRVLRSDSGHVGTSLCRRMPIRQEVAPGNSSVTCSAAVLSTASVCAQFGSATVNCLWHFVISADRR